MLLRSNIKHFYYENNVDSSQEIWEFYVSVFLVMLNVFVLNLRPIRTSNYVTFLRTSILCLKPKYIQSINQSP